jgi:predicted lipoprotein with Yx(FWY)xxD motif
MNVFSYRRLLFSRVALPIVATALVATACSSASGSAQSASSSPASVGGKPAQTVVVKVLEGPLGSYLADGSGRALYLFAADTGSTSTCTGSCSSYWPPLLADGSVTASGSASAKDVATTNRPDGGKQVTYAGHPLYYYVGDEQAGETGGQGLDDFGAEWWLVAPSGQEITSSAAGSMNGDGGSVGGGSY